MTTEVERPKCAIWARVSTEEQHASNQLVVLRQWAEQRGFDVVREFVTEDSAWTARNGNGTKGKEFDRQRRELSRGAHHGDYTRILIWSLDRLSRRGIKDTIGILDDLTDAGAVICSHQESWMETTDPRLRELIISIMSWLAETESARRSERVMLGLERRRSEIEEGKIEGRIGGRAHGQKDRRKRSNDGYRKAWEPGGKRYEERLAKGAALLADPVRLRELHRDTECQTCGAAIGDPCRIAEGRLKGEIKSRPHAARLHVASEEQRKTGEG